MFKRTIPTIRNGVQESSQASRVRHLAERPGAKANSIVARAEAEPIDTRISTMSSGRLRPEILPPDFYDILPEDWDVELSRDSIILISPSSKRYFIGPRLLYTPAYRAILDEDFQERCEPPPDHCPRCNSELVRVNRGIKPSWEGKHIWNCLGSCEITVPEQLDMPQEQLEKAISQRHEDVRHAILDILCSSAQSEDAAPHTPSRKRPKTDPAPSTPSVGGTPTRRRASGTRQLPSTPSARTRQPGGQTSSLAEHDCAAFDPNRLWQPPRSASQDFAESAKEPDLDIYKTSMSSQKSLSSQNAVEHPKSSGRKRGPLSRAINVLPEELVELDSEGDEIVLTEAEKKNEAADIRASQACTIALNSWAAGYAPDDPVVLSDGETSDPTADAVRDLRVSIWLSDGEPISVFENNVLADFTLRDLKHTHDLLSPRPDKGSHSETFPYYYLDTVKRIWVLQRSDQRIKLPARQFGVLIRKPSAVPLVDSLAQEILRCVTGRRPSRFDVDLPPPRLLQGNDS
ncbi:hypothetical protein NM688_g8934 [Phlebia brevispora]|uniref:Uncharacterized protein n=1 Tax=Phlebia brevispora TaxID=194682 RepID=A0ACC1RLC4_9APHY|nr:hypothetical protein NM688_g8934 [Phlebia brevispora]